mmetsp:Transcript_22429/g.76888  ORF Transcript_22429/g.76888 Transcript_22429/m.76888 type:complete len:369 (-) Transcript_22429:559-1665(-)
MAQEGQEEAGKGQEEARVRPAGRHAARRRAARRRAAGALRPLRRRDEVDATAGLAGAGRRRDARRAVVGTARQRAGSATGPIRRTTRAVAQRGRQDAAEPGAGARRRPARRRRRRAAAAREAVAGRARRTEEAARDDEQFGRRLAATCSRRCTDSGARDSTGRRTAGPGGLDDTRPAMALVAVARGTDHGAQVHLRVPGGADVPLAQVVEPERQGAPRRPGGAARPRGARLRARDGAGPRVVHLPRAAALCDSRRAPARPRGPETGTPRGQARGAARRRQSSSRASADRGDEQLSAYGHRAAVGTASGGRGAAAQPARGAGAARRREPRGVHPRLQAEPHPQGPGQGGAATARRGGPGVVDFKRAAQV